MLVQSQLEFDYLLHGIQHSYVAFSKEQTHPLTHQQKSVYGANANLLFGQRQGSWAWLVGPYIKYWNIAESNTVPVYVAALSSACVVAACIGSNTVVRIELCLEHLWAMAILAADKTNCFLLLGKASRILWCLLRLLFLLLLLLLLRMFPVLPFMEFLHIFGMFGIKPVVG